VTGCRPAILHFCKNSGRLFLFLRECLIFQPAAFFSVYSGRREETVKKFTEVLRMNLFESVKAAVTVRQAAGHYGVEVQRNGMCRCPFHNDRHPSMKLNEDYFYCFGCGAHGDVVDFTARLFGLSSLQAAQKLAYDFGIGPDKPPAAAALKKTEYPLARAFQKEELHCQRVLCDYLHLLEGWKERFAPSGPEEELDDRFVEACQMLDRIEYLTDALSFADLRVRVKTVDMLRRDGTIDKLEERLKRLKKEADTHGETEMD